MVTGLERSIAEFAHPESLAPNGVYSQFSTEQCSRYRTASVDKMYLHRFESTTLTASQLTSNARKGAITQVEQGPEQPLDHGCGKVGPELRISPPHECTRWEYHTQDMTSGFVQVKGDKL